MAVASPSAGSPPKKGAADGSEKTARNNRILSSKLYSDVPRSKVPVVYSSSYDIAFLGIEKLHPFDSSKWRRVCQFLITDKILDKLQIVEPLEASKEDLLVTIVNGPTPRSDPQGAPPQIKFENSP